MNLVLALSAAAQATARCSRGSPTRATPRMFFRTGYHRNANISPFVALYNTVLIIDDRVSFVARPKRRHVIRYVKFKNYSHILNGAPFSYRNRTPHLYEIFLLRFVIWLLRAYKYRQLRP